MNKDDKDIAWLKERESTLEDDDISYYLERVQKYTSLGYTETQCRVLARNETLY